MTSALKARPSCPHCNGDNLISNIDFDFFTCRGCWADFTYVEFVTWERLCAEESAAKAAANDD